METIEWKKREPDWLDKQCNKVFDALEGLTLDQKLGVIEQVEDYLRMEESLEIER